MESGDHTANGTGSQEPQLPHGNVHQGAQSTDLEQKQEFPAAGNEISREPELSNNEENQDGNVAQPESHQPLLASTGEQQQDGQKVAINGVEEITAADISISPQPQLSEVRAEDFPQRVPTLWELFIESVSAHPTNLALASIHQKGQFYGLPNLPLDHEIYKANPYLRWSYSDFANGVIRVIQALSAEGAVPGYPIFTFCDNSAEFCLILWAAIALGCIFIPIHPRNLLNKEEAIHIIKQSKTTTSFDDLIIFAQNSDLAKQALDLGVITTKSVIILDDQGPETTWRSFKAFLPGTVSDSAADLTQYNQSTSKWSLILFTSGTTALPKGVVVDSYRMDHWMSARRHAVPIIPGDSCFMTLPNNHAFFYLFELLFPGVGAGIVLAGPRFLPQSAPEGMELEKCTHFPMAPTMIHAIMEVLKARDLKFNTIKNITTGGAKLSIEFVRGCLDTIGSKGVEVIYGSTEMGVSTSTGVVTDADSIVRNDDASVGIPCLGSYIKVCHPGDRNPLPRNIEGELHYAGAQRSMGYAGGEMPADFFYTDEQGNEWFTTGDAAVINDEGLIFIVGRLKDTIIRGGMNIAPAAIEFVLGKDPATEPFNVQIVGRLDPIAGEVPIGVSAKPVTPDDVEKIQSVILQHMGPVFQPEEIITLEQLGIPDFPKTMLGKVQKDKLKPIVRQYYQDREALKTKASTEADELTKKIQKVWIRTIGHAVDIEAEISSFADSITIMRVRDRFKKELGTDISLAKMLEIKTVSEQIKLIKEQSEQKAAAKPPVEVMTGGPSVDDLIHLTANPQFFAGTKEWINEQIGAVGFKWDDIQEIAPASDFTSVMLEGDVINTSWSWKFAFLAREGIGKQDLRKGLEVMLENNPMLASFVFANRPVFGSDIMLHVMLKHTAKLYDLVIHDYGSIATKQDFANEVFKPHEYQMSIQPGILVNFLLFDVEDCNQSGTIMVLNHAPVDASYMQILLDDFDKAIGGAPLDRHIDYKIWADSYYSLRTCFEAQVAVAWQVRRLDNLIAHKRSVFPPQFNPHDTVVRTHVQDVADNGHHTDFRVPGISKLRSKYRKLTAPTIIKAAWTLLNIHRNGTNTALYCSLQADRRRFPFVPKVLEQLSPAHTFEAGRVAGPTLQAVVNILPLYPEEFALAFMHRIAADQEDLNRYAPAPLKSVLKDIGPVNTEIMIDIIRCQIFNWTPGLGALQTFNPNENYEPLSSFIRPTLRLVINVDVGGPDDETCYAQIKSPLFDKKTLKSLADDLRDFATWLCDENNWERRMGDFKTALRSEEERAFDEQESRQHLL